MRIGSLFAGIGGFDLAGEWCGHRTIWTSEIDPYCVALLAERFPDAKQLGDITRIDWSTVERPDIICGGFPCVEISSAGKKRGLVLESGLWREYIRAVASLRPPYAILENSAALFRRGWGEIEAAFGAIGYTGEVGEISACAVGAPHARRRLYALAYPDSDGQPTLALDEEAPRMRQNARRVRHGWGTKPSTLRMADGLPRGMDRVRGLGNAIVPECAIPLFDRIADLEAERLMQEDACLS